MKKTCLTLLVAAISVSVFAQGRLTFNNDSLHLVYFNPDPAALAPADAALAGKAVPTDGSFNGSLTVDLYGGTSSSSMSLMGTTTFGLSSPAGEWNSSNLALLYPGGTQLYFQVVVQNLAGDPGYYGSSVVFSGAPGTGVPTLSKLTDYWSVGTYPLPDWGSGAKGAIMLSYVPEPSTFALLLLAGAVLARKSTKR